MPKNDKGARLCNEWGLVANQCLYSEWGNFYGLIKSYPAVLLDSNGYLYLESPSAINIPGIKIGKRINVPKRISSLPGYVKVKQENIDSSHNANYLNMENIEYKDESPITKSQWKDILQNNEIARELDIKTVLAVYNSPLHRSTATEIAEVLGEKDFHVISGGNISFSRRICAYLNIKPPKNNKGGNRWWTIPYLGASKGDGKWFYILRPELKKAIEELISEGKISLKDTLDSIPEKDFQIAEEIPEENADKLFEGAKKQVIVNAYERNSKARAKCIEYYKELNNGKTVCQICDFDFGAVYGEEMEGKIHVHHLKPLYEIGDGYEVDAINDLIPICPNCHLVIHTKEPAYTPEEIKKMLKNRS